jgi:polyisoprenoid-binding protein YceI
MLKFAASFFAAALLFLAIPSRPTAPSGSWQVDARHSDARLSTDGTTDFGKTNMTFTIGYARVNGTVKLDADPANSAFDFRIYPAFSMAPPIDEEGKIKNEWFAHHANSTLMCFHSKGAQRTPEGSLKTTGNLVLTRMDRNVELTPNEGYSGPVYGPPMIHRVSHEATFVFGIPPTGDDKDGAVLAYGVTKVAREDFPQLTKAVIATFWPPVVQDKNCDIPVGVGEGYSGSQCTGTFLETPPLPEPPRASAGAEDYPGPSGFNSVTGDRLSIVVRLRLTQSGSAAHAGGN